MPWVKVAAEGVSRISYDENRQSLKVKFTDGSIGFAVGVIPTRYAEFIALAPQEQTTYFRNIIAPFIQRKTGGGRPLRRVAIIAAKILVAALLVWVFFQLIDLVRLRGA